MGPRIHNKPRGSKLATERVLVYPHPRGTEHIYIAGGVPKGLHQTSGLAHNWALDFMAPGGTWYLAPEKGTVLRWSGHDPKTGVHDGDIYGWSLYLLTPDGLVYFATHLEDRYARVGAKVKKGQVIGKVGHWPHDPGRSHTHLGVTHPMGDKASKRAILNVAAAPKVKAIVPL